MGSTQQWGERRQSGQSDHPNQLPAEYGAGEEDDQAEEVPSGEALAPCDGPHHAEQQRVEAGCACMRTHTHTQRYSAEDSSSIVIKFIEEFIEEKIIEGSKGRAGLSSNRRLAGSNLAPSQFVAVMNLMTAVLILYLLSLKLKGTMMEK